MNTALLLQWLHLPPGLWPPDDRALLGLPTGPIDSTQVELNALARMELLRPHQLKHPEVVTEGMNRLAQSLIALTSTTDIAPSTMSLRKPPRKAVAKSKPAPAAFPLVDLAPAGPGAPAITVAAAPAPILEAEEIVEAEIVPLPLPIPQVEVIEALPPGLVVIPEIPRSEDRRKSYRHLVYLRKLHRAWLALQPVLAVPSEPLVSAEMVYRLLVGFQELRPLLRRGGARYQALNFAGDSVLALARQPQCVLVLREFLPGQRQKVALDWATAKASLEGQMLAVRKSLKRPRTRDAFAELRRTIFDRLRQNPEWILGVLTAFLVVSGVVKTLAR